MLYESSHLRVEADEGIATLWLEFPGSPVNALTPNRLGELGSALEVLRGDPHLEALVIRSGRPTGFCAGHDPALLATLSDDESATTFARTGQRLLGQLAELDLVTVAFLEGPCLGPGLELALACDYRLAVAGPDSFLGFPDAAHGLPPCWGGSARLRRTVGRRTAARLLRGEPLTARETYTAGLVDHACCARRGKIDLRTFLDRLTVRRRKPVPSEELAAERMAFRLAVRSSAVQAALQDGRSRHAPTEPLPERVGLIGTDDRTAALAVEIALRGATAVVATGDEFGAARIEGAIRDALTRAIRRGRATPLEADQTRRRIAIEHELEHAADAPWLLALDPDGPALAFVERRLQPRAILTVPPDRFPDLAPLAIRAGRIVPVDLSPNGATRVPDEPAPGPAAVVAGWLRQLGFPVTFTSPRPSSLLHQAA